MKKQRRRATSGDVKLMSSRRERVRSKTESMKNSEKYVNIFTFHLCRYVQMCISLSLEMDKDKTNLFPCRLSRSFSSAGILSSNSSSFDGSAFSVFRSRNMSTTSTASLVSKA